MIFHKNFFQLVTAPIPLFQTPQKIGLFKNKYYVQSGQKKYASSVIRYKSFDFII